MYCFNEFNCNNYLLLKATAIDPLILIILLWPKIPKKPTSPEFSCINSNPIPSTPTTSTTPPRKCSTQCPGILASRNRRPSTSISITEVNTSSTICLVCSLIVLLALDTERRWIWGRWGPLRLRPIPTNSPVSFKYGGRMP